MPNLQSINVELTKQEAFVIGCALEVYDAEIQAGRISLENLTELEAHDFGVTVGELIEFFGEAVEDSEDEED